MWLDAHRSTRGERRRWKTVSGRGYLCAIRRGTNHATSLGARDERTEALHEKALADEARAADTWDRLLIHGRLYKASRLPLVEGFAGALLCDLDADGFLGAHLLVVGSNAMVAYELEAGQVLDPGLRATEDFDLTWAGGQLDCGLVHSPLLRAFKRADATWTVNTECEFQVRNQRGEMVDVLVAPSLAAAYPRSEAIRACALAGQEELLGGRPVAPAPRLFALHKLRLTDEPKRTALKRAKDRKQGEAVLGRIAMHLPHYPWESDFMATLPEPLRAVAKRMNVDPGVLQPDGHGTRMTVRA